VYSLCSTGALAHLRVMNSIRVPGEAVRNFLEGSLNKL
jgi:hypothetical protein